MRGPVGINLATLAALLCGLIVVGCTNGMGAVPETEGDYTLAPGCDPDSVAACSDNWFNCVEDDDGNKRCEGARPSVPDDGDWDCSVEGDLLVCEGDHMPGEASGWECTEENSGDVTCTTDSYQPGDGGQWECWFEGDFLICESGVFEEGGSTEENPEIPEDGSSSGGSGSSDIPEDGSSSGGSGSTDIPEGSEDICFFDEADPDGPPIVSGWYEIDSVGGAEAVHVVLIFNEGFVDNTYGVNSSDGYRGGQAGGHRFRDLVSSDHAEVGFEDASGREVLLAKFDYLTQIDGTNDYDALSAFGGDGSLLSGDGSAILDATSSLDRNFNELGCVFTVDSPTEEECPGWDNRVIYEMWIATSAFGSAGFGRPMLTFVHASPSRTTDTIPVEPGPCP